MKKIIFIIALFFLNISFLWADNIVTAAYVPAGYYLPFIIMENDGLLSKRGYQLKLNSHKSNAEMINQFINGRLDVTAQSALTMFPVEEKHPGKFKFIYAQEMQGYSFVVPDKSTIKTLSDLKKKKIGIWTSPTAEVAIKIALHHEGLNKGDYDTKRYPADQVVSALENKQVDAVFLFDVPAQHLVNSKNFRYLASDTALNNILDVIEDGKLRHIPIFNGGAFINQKLISSNPAKAQAIRDALLEAIIIINKEPERVRGILAKKIGALDVDAQNAHYDIFYAPEDKAVESSKKTLELLKNNGVVTADKINDNLFWQ
jgi:ABC-type nitrate/sulfonate/bicarbonate transport system substrate-binding protein